MSELDFFYSNLYKENNSHSSSFLDDLKEVPTLTEELRMVCEGRIEYNECFNVLQSFPKNKTPGNDVLPNLIHPSQNAFVKGRSIFDAIRTIDDIVDYTKRNSWSGFMIAIDFEKALYTLDFRFLIRTLHKFNFGPSFIQWMRVLYKNASSCVMNNGFTTGPFLLGRGVRQGDPLSPYLFILALETLAIKIREDCNVQGLKIGEEMIKLSLFADLYLKRQNILYKSVSYSQLFWRVFRPKGE